MVGVALAASHRSDGAAALHPYCAAIAVQSAHSHSLQQGSAAFERAVLTFTVRSDCARIVQYSLPAAATRLVPALLCRRFVSDLGVGIPRAVASAVTASRSACASLTLDADCANKLVRYVALACAALRGGTAKGALSSAHCAHFAAHGRSAVPTKGCDGLG